MSDLVQDENSALEDLLECCHGAIYAYGIIAAYLTNPDQALDSMAEYRKHRDELLATFDQLGLIAPAAKAAYSLPNKITDESSAKATGAMLEENAVAHWANAYFYLPEDISERESKFLQRSAARAFSWSGIAKAFSSAN